MTLLVVGSANADLVVRVARHPGPGETVLGAADLVVHPGGKGANQAVAAGRLGARVGFCGKVGDDAHGERLAAVLRDAGVDTAALSVAEGVPTGVALVTVAEGGENTIVVAPGANARLTAREAAEAVGPRVRVVSAQCEVPLAAVRAAALAAPRFVLNASPAEALAGAEEAADVLGRADPLVVNEHEMAVLLGRGEAGEARPEDLLRLGVRSAVVTLGAAGAVVVGPDGVAVLVPAPAVEAVDTTGAGDAFTGALAWRLAEGDALPDAVGWAVRAGAAAVQEPGAHLSSTACGKLLGPRS
ncbi:ribokinase [Actinacidiphila rubida]|uniref:Ribokinase n=2 Tax=Actinacidiphila rubida TaxID=310780 RepID=A0A1H8QSR9_9ACTN|nr:ribokinase [Actinacidiphila rubida]SEO57270.1 ribokinase [Actinacidiphila rubida]